jgi:hypothetical protein
MKTARNVFAQDFAPRRGGLITAEELRGFG